MPQPPRTVHTIVAQVRTGTFSPIHGHLAPKTAALVLQSPAGVVLPLSVAAHIYIPEIMPEWTKQSAGRIRRSAAAARHSFMTMLPGLFAAESEQQRRSVRQISSVVEADDSGAWACPVQLRLPWKLSQELAVQQSATREVQLLHT